MYNICSRKTVNRKKEWNLYRNICLLSLFQYSHCELFYLKLKLKLRVRCNIKPNFFGDPSGNFKLNFNLFHFNYERQKVVSLINMQFFISINILNNLHLLYPFYFDIEIFHLLLSHNP